MKDNADGTIGAVAQSAPLVSIITITYKHASYIARTLESFVSQKTDFPFEVIVADDCSPDGTADIIRQFAQKYPDIIRPILREKNVGPEDNFLLAAQEVRGKYVAVCDGDDYFLRSDKLQRQVDLLEKDPTLSICCARAREVWDDGSHPDRIMPNPERTPKSDRVTMQELLDANFILSSTVMYRWRFSNTNIEDFVPRGMQPGDFYLHMLHAQTGDIAFMDEVVSVYNRHTGGIWWDFDADRENHILKHGVSEIKLTYEVYRNFTGLSAAYRDQSVVGLLGGFIEVCIRKGAMDEIAELERLGPEFFEEIGDKITVETIATRQHRRRKSRRRVKKALALFAVSLVGAFYLGTLFG